VIRFPLALVSLLLLQQGGFAKLEVKNLQASHGPYGPERTSLEVMPQDEIFFRFQLLGVKANADGKTEVEETIRLTNSEGKAVFEKSGTVSLPLMLGGNSLTTHVVINIGPKAPPGEYTLLVTLKDKIGNESTSFEKKITCKATSFAVIVPRFYRDAESKVPAPVGGLVNETIYFQLFCVGFNKKDKQVRVTMTLQVLDEQGKDVLPKPIEVLAAHGKAEDVESAIKLTFKGAITLSRAGDYKLRIVLEDSQGKQNAKFETPLKVAVP
jgi:hypothetical protein